MTAAVPWDLLRTGRRGSCVVLAALLGLLLAGCGGRRAERVSAVPVMAPPPPATVVVERPDPNTVIAATPPAPAPGVLTAPTAPPPAPPEPDPAPPVAPSPPRVAEWDPTEADRFGFDGDKYLKLLTPEEVDILRLRSRGDMVSHLSRFLSEKEKENLRRRDAELTEIGAEPLRIGE